MTVSPAATVPVSDSRTPRGSGCCHEVFMLDPWCYGLGQFWTRVVGNLVRDCGSSKRTDRRCCRLSCDACMYLAQYLISRLHGYFRPTRCMQP